MANSLQVVHDFRRATLAPADRALCEFAVRLTLAPGKARATDLEALRRHGLDDRQIHLATQVIAYFNYINRVADGLGVDDEAWMARAPFPSREEWLTTKARYLPGDV
jgi:uncharacterized peroxidase-related enzyme